MLTFLEKACHGILRKLSSGFVKQPTKGITWPKLISLNATVTVMAYRKITVKL